MSDNTSFPVESNSHPRDKLVAFAVRFLNTPGVLGTSVNSQIDFLRKKGLTPHEIRSALRSVKLASPPSIDKSDNKLWLSLSYYLLPDSFSPVTTLFSLTRAALSLTILLYLSYRLIELVINMNPRVRVVLNRLYLKIRLVLGFEPTADIPCADQPTEGLSLDSLQKMETSPLVEGFDLADIIGADSQEIESIRREFNDLKANQENSISELKSEIKSVRSLLLSSSQFPKPQTIPPDASEQTDNSSLEFKPSGLFHTRSMPPATNRATRDTMGTHSSSAMDFLNSLSDSDPPTNPADIDLV